MKNHYYLANGNTVVTATPQEMAAYTRKRRSRKNEPSYNGFSSERLDKNGVTRWQSLGGHIYPLGA